MRFTKMEGAGNDYIFINGLEEKVEDPAALSVKMSRPHLGCGSDGLIIILPSDVADFRMEVYNRDGSDGQMCGNGIRCLGKYCYDRGLIRQTAFTVEAGGGIKRLQCLLKDGAVDGVRVDMGQPVLDGISIPSTVANEPVVGFPLVVRGRKWPVTLVNMGNPHAVIMVDDLETAPVAAVGAALERDPVFPERTNIEFVVVQSPERIAMRVWERGAGETLACGTGACAAVVACVLNGFSGRMADVDLLGGALRVEWCEQDNHVYMTGPAVFVYDGVWLQ